MELTFKFNGDQARAMVGYAQSVGVRQLPVRFKIDQNGAYLESMNYRLYAIDTVPTTIAYSKTITLGNGKGDLVITVSKDDKLARHWTGSTPTK